MKKPRVNRMERPKKIGGLGDLMIKAGVSRPEPASSEKEEGRLKYEIAKTPSTFLGASGAPGVTLKKSTKLKDQKSKRPREKKAPSAKRKAAVLLDILGRQENSGRKYGKRKPNETIKPPAQPDNRKPFVIQAKERLEKISEKHTFRLREVLSIPDKSDREEIQRRNLTLKQWVSENDSVKENVEIISIGFDLGSTSTKIVIRFPYNSSLGAFAIPAPPGLQADDHPYFWTTRVWRNLDETYSLVDVNDAICFDALKVDFIRATKHGAETATILNEAIRVIAFMALMIRQAVGWLIDTLSNRLSNSQIEISANFGFPAERVDGQYSGELFRICSRAALHLALSQSQVSDETVREAYTLVVSGKDSHEVRVVPEFIGAVFGFFHSSRRHSGQYMLCDFGGLTCDIVCFNLFERSDGSLIFSIYAGLVRNYGSEVIEAAFQEGISQEEVTAAMGFFAVQPIFAAWEKKGRNEITWKSEMPLFVIGGGRHSKAYKDMFDWTENSLSKVKYKVKFHQEPMDLGADSGLDMPLAGERNSSRLLVALGLSWSPYDLPDWLTPDQIIPPSARQSFTLADRFVGPEQT